jgi:hypothetical protein
MADDLKYGYKGAEPTQSFGNNTGVFDPNDINNLIADNKWTTFGQLELIQTQTVDDPTYASLITSIDFTNLGDYNVHFLVYNDFQTQGYGYPSVRFSNNGGSSFISASYQYAYWNTSENTVREGYSTSDDGIKLGHNQYQNLNGYVYLYNLLDSSKYSFTTSQSSNVGGNNISKDVAFGSGVYRSAEVHNAIRFSMNNVNYIKALKISLYGIRYS